LSFGGGGSGGAALPLPHTHNATIVNDGGDLSVVQTRINTMPLSTYVMVMG